MKFVCACGLEFEARQRLDRPGKPRYCSNECKYKFRVRPSGLTYQKHKENPTSFKPGHESWNQGNPPTGESYRQLHKWVKRNKPQPDACEWCGRTGSILHCANLSHEYKVDLDDWAYLCMFCHYQYDRASGAWGVATKRFGKLDR